DLVAEPVPQIGGNDKAEECRHRQVPSSAQAQEPEHCKGGDNREPWRTELTPIESEELQCHVPDAVGRELKKNPIFPAADGKPYPPGGCRTAQIKNRRAAGGDWQVGKDGYEPAD